jgi:hypothetical protein
MSSRARQDEKDRLPIRGESWRIRSGITRRSCPPALAGGAYWRAFSALRAPVLGPLTAVVSQGITAIAATRSTSSAGFSAKLYSRNLS